MFPRTCLPLFDLHHSVHPTTMKAWAQRTINDRFRAYRKLIQNIPVYLLYSLFRSGPFGSPWPDTTFSHVCRWSGAKDERPKCTANGGEQLAAVSTGQ
jgi:hypothetical protein